MPDTTYNEKEKLLTPKQAIAIMSEPSLQNEDVRFYLSTTFKGGTNKNYVKTLKVNFIKVAVSTSFVLNINDKLRTLIRGAQQDEFGQGLIALEANGLQQDTSLHEELLKNGWRELEVNNEGK